MSEESNGTEATAEEDNQADVVNLKVGIVLSTGGLGDKNFNDMAYAGLLQAEEEFGIEFDYFEPKAVSDYIANFRLFAESGEYDLIIGIGNEQVDAVTQIAAEYPEIKFSLIDSAAEIENVRTVYTDWTHQTFLCGVIAGLETTAGNLPKTNEENVIGVVVGKEYPALMEGVTGFMAGVKYVNPDAEILSASVGDFADPAKGKEIALSMYSRNADFVQHIAGASGLGVFAAAEETDNYAFGVGGNQNAIEPDYIVATSIRNVNEMVFNEVWHVIQETWVTGSVGSGIKQGSVGYSVEGSNVTLSEETIKIVEEAKKRIIDGELIPCRTVEELEAWTAENQYFN
ncbi:BMP family lipoprotein [Vallitalea sp.]|uniref:BMP family lipoprotein n=1 Tax=Vallitalea sp. TaxID=1882829 RepID=UPI0025CE77DA|nr:BMP family ABC transporter substrate-binding protein [Vallitalea sp.]MCT4686137.1 BMP family ABC transporter substrate-binding protein [Vallitalea sp.]